MEILLKEQKDNFRFVVAKIIFYLLKKYKFISDIQESNLMLVYDKEKKYISSCKANKRNFRKI